MSSVHGALQNTQRGGGILSGGEDTGFSRVESGDGGSYDFPMRKSTGFGGFSPPGGLCGLSRRVRRGAYDEARTTGRVQPSDPRRNAGGRQGRLAGGDQRQLSWGQPGPWKDQGGD